MSRVRAHLSVFVSALAGLSVLTSGCGGSKAPSVASVATTSTPTSRSGAGNANATGSAPTTQGRLQDDALKYAKCIRANGVPAFPDPQAGGGFQFQAGTGIGPASSEFKAAQSKCQKLMPGSPPGPGATTHPSPQWLAHMVHVARCMRRHGRRDFPDPRTSVPANPFGAGGAGVISDIQGVILIFPSTIDTQSTIFTQAAAACGFPLHNH